MLGDFLRAIFGMMEKGDYVPAQDKLDEAFVTLLKKDATSFDGIAPGELMSTLMQDPDLAQIRDNTLEYLEILAGLFYARALLSEAQHKMAQSEDCLLKSLILYEEVDNVSQTFSVERQTRMRSIREKLRHG